MRVLLIRHGQTDWNVDRKIMGELPIPLNKTGKKQARALRKSLVPYPLDVIYSSPMLRALQTAEILVGKREIQIVQEKRLEEVHYGDWVGKSFAEVLQGNDYSLYYQRPEAPVAPGGEALQEVQNRMWNFIMELSDKYPQKTLAIISHADTLKSFLIKTLGISFEAMVKIRFDNASVSVVEIHQGSGHLIAHNISSDFSPYFQKRKG